MWITGLPASAWETGAWADVAQLMGGPVLRIALVAGGMMSGFGMFNALVMSYSRLPLAMAQDGMLPKVFGKLHPKSRAPWVAILALAIGWGLALNLGFERLVTLDIMIYGASLALEFVALICLRIREPELKRPFRVPGGLFGAIAVGIPPVLLLGFAIIRSEHEVVLGMSSLWFGADRDRRGRRRLPDQPCAETGGLGSAGAEAGDGGVTLCGESSCTSSQLSVASESRRDLSTV